MSELERSEGSKTLIGKPWDAFWRLRDKEIDGD